MSLVERDWAACSTSLEPLMVISTISSPSSVAASRATSIS